jgi:hypothetical protein
MRRSVLRFALVAALGIGPLMPAGAIAGEARAVMQVGITITGIANAATAPKGHGASQKAALPQAGKPAAAR